MNDGTSDGILTAQLRFACLPQAARAAGAKSKLKSPIRKRCFAPSGQLYSIGPISLISLISPGNAAPSDRSSRKGGGRVRRENRKVRNSAGGIVCPHKRDARRLKFRLCAIQTHGGIIDTVERFDGSAVFMKINSDHIFSFPAIFRFCKIHSQHTEIKGKAPDMVAFPENCAIL